MTLKGSRELNPIPKDKMPAFLKLMQALEVRFGCQEHAAKACGINSGRWHLYKTGAYESMPNNIAKKILSTYKAGK